MTVKELADYALGRLVPRFGRGEARWMVRMMMEEFKNYSEVDMVVRGDFPAGDHVEARVRETIERLLAGEPIQYIFGRARFFGMDLKVTPDVLIPRPETEELVDIIVRDNGRRSDLRVLDACTGSGCIAVALARNLPFAEVTAFDISEKALDVARENARNLHARIDFFRADALSLPLPEQPQFDIIVSNPPYIAEHERRDMESNVLDHEPAFALFVPDSDPLLFYLALGRYALKALNPGGHLYFEINPLYAGQLRGEMLQMGWQNVELQLDMQKKQRFLIASL